MDESVRQHMMGFVYQAVEVTKKIRNEKSNLYSDIFDESEPIEEKNLISFYTKKFEEHHTNFGTIRGWPDIPDMIERFVNKKSKKLYKLLKEEHIDFTQKIFKNPFNNKDESFQTEEEVINTIQSHIKSYTKTQVEQFLNSEWSDENNKLNLESIDTIEKSLTTPILKPEDRSNTLEEIEQQLNDKISDEQTLTTDLKKPELPANLVYASAVTDDSGVGVSVSNMDLTGDSDKRKSDEMSSEKDTEHLTKQSGNTSTLEQEPSQSTPKRSKTVNEMDKASYYLTEGNANLPNTILAYYYLKMRDYVRVMRRMANYARVYRGDEDEIAMIEFKTTEDDKLVEKIHHTYSSNKQSSKDRYANIKKFLRADDIRVMKGVQKLEPEEKADFSETDLYKKSNSNDNKWIYKHHSQ